MIYDMKEKPSADSLSTLSVRDSNMELLRIASMLMVVLFHVDLLGMAYDQPQWSSLSAASLSGYALLKSLTMSCVNIFVLISGLYGLRLTLGKFLSLVFQVVFFSLAIYLWFVFSDAEVAFSLSYFFRLAIGSGYWFVPSYLLLFLFSPILNLFVEHIPKRQFAVVLVSLFGFMFVYSWLVKDVWFDKGCSPLFFFLLYLLGRYLKLYPCRLSAKNAWYYLAVFVLTAVVVALLSVLFFKNGYDEVGWRLFQNNSPFNILCSLSMLLFFSKIPLKNRLINRFGISCFSLYLFHAHPVFFDKVFYRYVHFWFVTTSGLSLFFRIVLFVIVLSVVSFLFDAFFRTLRQGAMRCLRPTNVR